MRKSSLLLLTIVSVLILALFAGCTHTYFQEVDFPEGTDPMSMEDAIAWYQCLLPGVVEGDPRIEDSGNTARVLYWNSITITLWADRDDPGKLVQIWMNIFGSEDDPAEYPELCIRTAEHFLDDHLASSVVSLLNLGPVTDDPYSLPVNPNFDINFHSEYNQISFYGYADTINVDIDAETGTPFWFSITLNPPTANPVLQSCQENVNQALAQAGHPVSVYIGQHYTYLFYTGSGTYEDQYARHISLTLYTEDDSAIPYLSIRAYPPGGDVSRDALRVIMAAVAQSGKNSFTQDFTDDFFEMRLKTEDGTFTNQHGTTAEVLADSKVWVNHYSNNRHLYYTEDLYGDSIFVDGEINAYHMFSPVNVNDVLPAFTKLHPVNEYYHNSPDEHDLIYRMSETGEHDFHLLIYIRPADQAIACVEAFCADSAEARQRFEEATADLVDLFGLDITKEEILDICKNPVDSFGDGLVMVSRYESNNVSFAYQDVGMGSEKSYSFSLEFMLPDLPPADPSINYFVREDLLGGPAVSDGQFCWLPDADLILFPMIFEDYFGRYLSYADVPLGICVFVKRFQEPDGSYRILHDVLTSDGAYLDGSEYKLVTHLGSRLYFDMNYNDNEAVIAASADGQALTQTDIWQLPVCLSLLCDDGMTAEEAMELFSHAMEPTATEESVTETIYCPRDVAHILTYDAETGKNRYTVMTKADFETTYGGSLDAFIQNHS